MEIAWPLLDYQKSHIPDNSPYQRFINSKESLQNVLDYIRKNDQNVRYGYHFNAHKVANYFKEIALKRQIIHQIGTVKNLLLNDIGNVKSIILEKDNDELSCDLVIDCSGMNRVIASKLKNYKFMENNHLLVDRGLGFFLPHEVTGFSLLTEAIAMKFGWMWIIPTQERSGCGYVFSSKHCSFEEAKIEIESYFNCKIDFPIEIKFKSGVVEKPFNGNVITLGLATRLY